MATVSSVLLFLFLNVKHVAQQNTQNALVHFHGYNGYTNALQCYVVCKMPIFPWSIYNDFIVR